MSEENVEIVRETFEAWNRRDFDRAQEAWSPDVVVEISAQSTMRGTYSGLDGLREVLRFWGAFADFHSDIEECAESGDEVVATLHHHGRGKSSGIEVDMRNWQVFTVRDGKIVRYRIYDTRERALEAAGLSE
jgi:ketosteroid isomerase-like protein